MVLYGHFHWGVRLSVRFKQVPAEAGTGTEDRLLLLLHWLLPTSPPREGKRSPGRSRASEHVGVVSVSGQRGLAVLVLAALTTLIATLLATAARVFLLLTTATLALSAAALLTAALTGLLVLLVVATTLAALSALAALLAALVWICHLIYSVWDHSHQPTKDSGAGSCFTALATFETRYFLRRYCFKKSRSKSSDGLSITSSSSLYSRTSSKPWAVRFNSYPSALAISRTSCSVIIELTYVVSDLPASNPQLTVWR